jgi:fused signal recognition particle receptor
MFWRRNRQELPEPPDDAAEAATAGPLAEDAEGLPVVAVAPAEAPSEPPVVEAVVALPEAPSEPPVVDEAATGPDDAVATAPDDAQNAPGLAPPSPASEAAAGAGHAPTLDAGVEASRRGFMSRLHALLRGGSPDAQTWEEVEEALIAGDVGARLSMEVVARARARGAALSPEAAVRAELEALLPPVPQVRWRPRRPDDDAPAVVLVVGVNGTGKTTSIAKLAARLQRDGDRVLLAAADTFRAAAVEQLTTWAGRLDVPIVAHKAGADPSAVVYDALDAAVARRMDVVIVDTAGRLHTRHNLMDELQKIRRTIDKRLPGAEPEVLFVLDATTGQNGLAQARAFHEATGLTGIVLTKLDSTAKGGIVFAIEQALVIPVICVGVGERVDDLVDFDGAGFVEALFR